MLTVRGGEPDAAGWPFAGPLLPHYRRTNPAPPVAEPLPGDEGVLVGNVHALPQVEVDGIATLRDEGKTVFVHCAGGTSRTPTVAALYLAERLGIAPAEALERVAQVLEHQTHNADFVTRLRGHPGGR